ncbi:MAG: DUF262 domain-containing protein [Bacteroidetes bacterium]|nr:DUF262 domain-containing protein [Bacteroidota bacterium]
MKRYSGRLDDVSSIKRDYGEFDIQALAKMFTHGELNLRPSFQRSVVWTVKEMAKLIDSIILGYPIPGIMLSERKERGKQKWEVIDGQQRLTAIFSFMGLKDLKPFRVDMDGTGGQPPFTWQQVKNRDIGAAINSYKIPYVSIQGDVSDIIDVFVRINSTGKPLSAQEKRNAKFMDNKLLQSASLFANKNARLFTEAHVLSSGQITRMKHVEFALELILSVLRNERLDKKKLINDTLSSDLYTLTKINKAVATLQSALNEIKRTFPEIVLSRYSSLADYYSLVIAFASNDLATSNLKDSNRRAELRDLLMSFSRQVDRARYQQQHPSEKNIDVSEEAQNYALSILEGTDSKKHRDTRHVILSRMIEDVCGNKDPRRNFSALERRIVFNSRSKPECSKCGKPLTWTNYSTDHVFPHSKGGKTSLENAAPMCKQCNSRKGNRVEKRRRAS